MSECFKICHYMNVNCKQNIIIYKKIYIIYYIYVSVCSIAQSHIKKGKRYLICMYDSSKYIYIFKCRT